MRSCPRACLGNEDHETRGSTEGFQSLFLPGMAWSSLLTAPPGHPRVRSFLRGTEGTLAVGRPGRAAVGPHLLLLAARHSSPDWGQAGGCQGRKEQGPRDGRDTSSTSGRQGKTLGLSNEPFGPLDGRPSQLRVCWSGQRPLLRSD